MRNFIFVFLLSISSIVSATELEAGQVWQYKTRPEDKNSTITILKTENYKDLGRIVHVRIDNVQLTNAMRGITIMSIPYMPFKEAAIKRSITRLAGRVPTVPDYQAGYEEWKRNYSAGQAKVFDTTISITLDSLFHAKWNQEK